MFLILQCGKKPIFIAQINEKRLKHDRNGQQI